ncbi:hypothetical protein TIFTF001_027778 [Ficus carica]|uniref:Uncharacterized protein n=1 Tax=Ficus carica TaxID=3494 RepID=A0AA88IZ44_FICCA|nr:hypothetical protein TIFTF001_027778 [Ficus carica]
MPSLFLLSQISLALAVPDDADTAATAIGHLRGRGSKTSTRQNLRRCPWTEPCNAGFTLASD